MLQPRFAAMRTDGAVTLLCLWLEAPSQSKCGSHTASPAFPVPHQSVSKVLSTALLACQSPMCNDWALSALNALLAICVFVPNWWTHFRHSVQVLHKCILLHYVCILAPALVQKLPWPSIHLHHLPALDFTNFTLLEILTTLSLNVLNNNYVIYLFICIPKSSKHSKEALSLLIKPLPLTNLHSTSHCQWKAVKHGEEEKKWSWLFDFAIARRGLTERLHKYARQARLQSVLRHDRMKLSLIQQAEVSHAWPKMAAANHPYNVQNSVV